jgi:NAD(P)-dependent dehydrogenase (short-subunit alcohol dehydrogenase family)
MTTNDSSRGRSLEAQIRAAADLLERIGEDRSLLSHVEKAEQRRLIHAAGKVWSPDETRRRQLTRALAKKRKADARREEEAARNRTGIRKLRRKPTFTTPNVHPPALPGEVGPATHDAPERAAADAPPASAEPGEQHCYVCKQSFTELHHFYDQLCPLCAALNYRKRGELADLSGRVALLTGGRVKIGYQAGIKLLRCGADLIVTTRFPRDAAVRYAQEEDFEEWGHRLRIYGLDLRHTPSVEAFCSELMRTQDRLDFIINNACQTVRRPPDFYRHMMEHEAAALDDMPPRVRALVGDYEGLRGYDLLPSATRNGTPLAPGAPDRTEAPGLTHAAQLSQLALLPEEHEASRRSSPSGGSTRTSSRSTCAKATHGAC